jgi:thiaminase
VLLGVRRRRPSPPAPGWRPVATPVRRLVGTYGDPAFTASTVAARAILDRVADQAGAATRARMREAFTTATRYEWMFWDAAWRRETFLPA